MRTLLVFLAVALLSVLASNQRLMQAGRFFNLAHLTAGGLVFLVFGAVLGPGGAKFLRMEEVNAAQPLLALGLGLAGLLIGLNLEPQLLRALPARVWTAAAAQSGFAFLAVGIPMSVLLHLTLATPLALALGAGTLLGGAASVSSSHLATLWFRAGRLDRIRGLSLSLLAMLDDLMGLAVLALALILSAHGDIGVGFGLLTLAVLLGLVFGALTAYLIHDSDSPAELTAILLGAVGLVSGAAAFLKVSTLIACVACGVTLAVVGGRRISLAYRALARTERPVYLVLLFLIGAHFDPFDWNIWLLVPTFVALRFLGKVFGGRIARRAATDALALPPEPGFALLGQGGLSLCLLIQFQLLVDHPSAKLVFGVGVIAAVINEVLGTRAFRLSLGPSDASPQGSSGAPT